MSTSEPYPWQTAGAQAPGAEATETQEEPVETTATEDTAVEEAPVTDEAHEDAVTKEDAPLVQQEGVQIREGAEGKDGHRVGWSGTKPKVGPAMSTVTVRDGGEGLFEHHV